MKKIILPLILIFIAYIPIVNADLYNPTVSTSENKSIAQTTPNPPPTPTVPTPTPPTPGQTATNNIASSITSLAGSTVLSISIANLDPDPPIAGEIMEVRIGIENIGSTAITNLMMEIIPEYPFEPVENTVKNVGIVEGFQVDSTANLKIIRYKMKINKDAPAGVYELKVKYYESGSSDKVAKSLYIDIKSRANVEVIHIDKTTLSPGEQGSLKFTINNVGNAPLRDITFKWENKDNAILPVGSDNTRYIKYIDVNEGFDLEYQVIADTNVNPGLYKLDLYMNYADSVNGTIKQLSTIAGVYVGGITDFDISFSESTNGETSFSIANIGSNPAYAVLIIIPRQKDWRLIGPNSVMIGNLNSGDYTAASYRLQSVDTIMSKNTGSNNPVSNSSSEKIMVQIAYTDTMGKRKMIDKEVELRPQNIAATDEKTDQGQGEGTSYIVLSILAIISLVSAYRKYGKQKSIDPNFKIWNLFRGSKKNKKDD